MKKKKCTACNGTGKHFTFCIVYPCMLCNGTGKIEHWDNQWPIRKPLTPNQ